MTKFNVNAKDSRHQEKSGHLRKAAQHLIHYSCVWTKISQSVNPVVTPRNIISYFSSNINILLKLQCKLQVS